MPSVYLDYNATTPIDPEIASEINERRELHESNPSSIHHRGRAARAILDDCRYRLAALWDCRPTEIVFTSGGTESNNLAVLGAARSLAARGKHLVVSAVEHHAVLYAFRFLAEREGFDVSVLPVDSAGRIDPDELTKLIRPETILVSVMAANNETGVVQPYETVARICRTNGIVFHCDAVQALGKLNFQSIHQFGAQLVAVCSHKLYGPKGIGALYCRSPFHLTPLLCGGAQENERRAGTENLAGIYGLTLALERFTCRPVFDPERLEPLTRYLESELARIPEVSLLGSAAPRLNNTVAFTVKGWDSPSLLAALDLKGICASGGAACSAGAVEPSHVLLAMGLSAERANSLIRFSLGRQTERSEVEYAVAAICEVLKTEPSVIADK